MVRNGFIFGAVWCRVSGINEHGECRLSNGRLCKVFEAPDRTMRVECWPRQLTSDRCACAITPSVPFVPPSATYHTCFTALIVLVPVATNSSTQFPPRFKSHLSYKYAHLLCETMCILNILKSPITGYTARLHFRRNREFH